MIFFTRSCRYFFGCLFFAGFFFNSLGCRPDNKEADTSVKQEVNPSLRQAKEALSRKEETMLSQMVVTAEVCTERAALLRQQGDIKAAESIEQAAITCYHDAKSTAETISKKRTLQFPESPGCGAIHTRPWDFTEPWKEIGPAQGAVTIDKNLMVHFSASPDIRDEQVERFAGWAPGSVQYLNLGNAALISDAALPAIAKIRGLIDLSFYGTNITDTQLDALAALPYLRQLNLMGTQITPEGIVRMAGILPGLTELALQDSQADDKVLWALRQCPRLERLICKGGKVSDVGIRHLDGLKNLRCLWIGSARITDRSIPALAAHQGIKEIVLMRTAVSEAGLRKLKEALPECNVSFN